MKNNIVYKVVYPNGDGYKSLGIVSHEDKYHLNYKIGEKTVPIEGKLFVFQTELEAVNYLENLFGEMVVLRCKTSSNVTDAPIYIPYGGPQTKEFWEDTLSGYFENWFSKTFLYWTTPKNTKLCGDVTPIKVVYRRSF
jgi:hypothetical protein